MNNNLLYLFSMYEPDSDSIVVYANDSDPFKLLGGELNLVVSRYTFVCFILHIHHILHFCVPRLKFLEP